MIDYQEELELAIDAAAESLPQEAYGAAMFILYWHAGGGAEMSWDDALAALRAWADTVEGVTLYDYGIDDNGDEVEYEAGYIDAGDIVRGVIGRELAGYL